MRGGFLGRLLRVDLSAGRWKEERLDAGAARLFGGSKGYAANILFRELGPKTFPLSPQNKVVMMTGPLTGTAGGPMPNRFSVCTKSPLTGLWLDSHCGGFWGPELKFAGWDGIIVEGRAKGPVHLRIRDSAVDIVDASRLWGKGTFETMRIIQDEENGGRKPRVLSIGPAGENLAPIACVIADVRAAGRGGAGAVLGSKNLKAVSVAGTGKVPLADGAAFDSLAGECRRKLLESQALKDRTLEGTAGNVRPVNDSGGLPTRNFQEGMFKGADEISGDALSRHLWNNSRNLRPCWGCVTPCAHYTVLEPSGAGCRVSGIGTNDAGSGGRADPSSSGTRPPAPGTRHPGQIIDEGPEYETVVLNGSNLGISDRGAIAYADHLMDDFGLDTISFGNTLGFLIECFDRGLIGEKDTDGIALRFGDPRLLLGAIPLAAFKTGKLGDLLARGVSAASLKIGKGSGDFAMHVKGLEIPAYDPRQSPAQALAYAVSDRGACHLRPFLYGSEHFGRSPRLDPASHDGKAAEVKAGQEKSAITDSLGICKFQAYGLGLARDILPLLNAATGLELSHEEFMGIGERVNNLTRMFNAREGADGGADRLPPRCLEPLSSGKRAGMPMDIGGMLAEYYRVCGWDGNGVPTREKLESLSLGFAVAPREG